MIGLQEWSLNNQPAEDLIYKTGYWEQIYFVRDTIAGMLAETLEEYKTIVKVISSHRSKSVRLPVYRIELKDGTAFTMRDNFYDWKVSVESYLDSNGLPHDIDVDFTGLFDYKATIHSCYCEGFPEELVYGSYADNKSKFTIELPDNYRLFTFFWLFNNRKNK